MASVAALWLTVVIIGLEIVWFVMPYGLWWFPGVMVLAVIGILLIVPKWMG